MISLENEQLLVAFHSKTWHIIRLFGKTKQLDYLKPEAELALASSFRMEVQDGWHTGCTGWEIERGWIGGEVHRFHTVTSLNDCHTHLIEGVTGPAIDLPSGGHIHYFEGYTTVNGMHPHSHYYRGATGNEV